MSRAGKFIPGGGGNKAGRSDPIRAPEPGAPPDPASGGKRPFGKGSGLNKPVPKKQKLPIVVMSALCCLLISLLAGYMLAYLPAIRSRDAALKQAQEEKMQIDIDKANEQKAKDDALTLLTTARGTLSVDSTPDGATVTLGDFRKMTPAHFTDIMPGTFPILIQADGYEDYRQEVTITADKPADLGTIALVPKTGNLSLSSPQSEVTYKVTGPGDYNHEGQLPDKLENLPVGDYLITVAQEDWKLSPMAVTIHDHDNIDKEIKFPYASVSIVSTPPGATVRDGRTVLGKTPLSLTQLRPRDLHLSLDLPPYTLHRLDLHVPDFGNMTKQVALRQGKDFIAACGMPMVWIPDAGFWAGKYQVRQSDFEAVTGDDPSTFRRPSRPVETISWDGAMAFCDKLNQYEAKAGRLPQGYRYTLPKESQWETFSADADIDLAATSRVTTLSSTQDVGYSEPNKYGIYDSIGNVWEWCLDDYDDKGDHSLRGGCWLSSEEHFPSAETRSAGGPKYTDQFTGFRVVLVPNG
jgi:hypothetical protein